jgi:transcription termination factor Rho
MQTYPSAGTVTVDTQGYGLSQPEPAAMAFGIIYIAPRLIRRYAIKTGDHIAGQVRPLAGNELYCSMVTVQAINGVVISV